MFQNWFFLSTQNWDKFLLVLCWSNRIALAQQSIKIYVICVCGVCACEMFSFIQWLSLDDQIDVHGGHNTWPMPCGMFLFFSSPVSFRISSLKYLIVCISFSRSVWSRYFARIMPFVTLTKIDIFYAEAHKWWWWTKVRIFCGSTN